MPTTSGGSYLNPQLDTAEAIGHQAPSSPLVKMPTFAKGGSVKETRALLKEGGMMDEGGTVDPISGNDVPVGAMKEEVRDDVPAQLSEGEFVIPADVVRYIGLERLMMMRQAAKEGLKKMEEMGQMSNAEEATMEDDSEFESEIDDILSELDSEGEDEGEDKEEVKMQAGGDVRAKVGTPTGEMSEAGRPLYKTAEGETVSEKSITVPFAGEWVNVPSIHDGVRYNDDEIEDMLAAGKIKPTSTHKNLDEAVAAAKARSNTLIKPKMQAGGMVEQTQQALAQDQQPQQPQVPALTEDQLAFIQKTAEGMKAQKMEVPPEQQSMPTEGLKSSDIVRGNLTQSRTPEETESFMKKVARLEKTAKLINIRHNDTVVLGFVKAPGVVDPVVFTQDDPARMQQAIDAAFTTAKQSGIKRLESSTPNPQVVQSLKQQGYDVQETAKGWSLDL